jgi:hypothetical protein
MRYLVRGMWVLAMDPITLFITLIAVSRLQELLGWALVC